MHEIHTRPSSPEVIQTVAALRAFVAKARAAGKSIALVPTMGALHDGHLELVRQGQVRTDIVIASIFVNPAQFGPNEDFKAYPRTWDADLAKLASVGANAVFYPSVAQMYPEGFNTSVHVSGVSEGLCGGSRPGHFDGVATVVSKLLLQCLPDVALFGEKDYQQLCVIRRMVADLNIPVAIEGVPTVRDQNGLALSSRNQYLDETQYGVAVQLNKTLFAMAGRIVEGEMLSKVTDWGLTQFEAAGFDKVDYLEVRDARTLAPVTAKEGRALRILAAVYLGRARLIDNVAA